MVDRKYGTTYWYPGVNLYFFAVTVASACGVYKGILEDECADEKVGLYELLSYEMTHNNMYEGLVVRGIRAGITIVLSTYLIRNRE